LALVIRICYNLHVRKTIDYRQSDDNIDCDEVYFDNTLELMDRLGVLRV